LDLGWKSLSKLGLVLALAFAAALLISDLLAWFVMKIVPVIMYFLLAFIIFYAISPLTKIMVDRKFPPVVAALVSFMVVLLFMGLLIYLMIPGMAAELDDLVRYLSQEFVPFFTGLAEDLEEMDRRLNLELAEPVAEYFTQMVEGLPELVEEIPQTVQRVFHQFTAITIDFVSWVWALVVIIFMVFYMLIEQEKIRRQVPRLFPKIYQKDARYMIETIDEKVGAYIRGTVLRCVIVGFFVGIVMYFLGMPFALMLGVLAGVLDVIVYVGPFIAAIPAVLFSFLPDTPHFLVIIGVYVLAQFLESMVLTPLLMGKAVDLSPLTVIAAILIGAQLAGLLGIIIAIPIAAVLKVFLHHYYLEKQGV